MSFVYLAPDGEIEIWRQHWLDNYSFVEVGYRHPTKGVESMEIEIDDVMDPELIGRVLIGEL